MSAGGVLSKFAAIGIVVIFAFAMWIIMKIVHKVKGDEEDIGADAAGPAADGMSRMNAHAERFPEYLMIISQKYFDLLHNSPVPSILL